MICLVLLRIKDVTRLVDEIAKGIYRMEIPIPNSPLKATNSYIIKGEKRNLLIDTGQNRSESLEAMQSGLTALSIDMAKTDIFLTHLHADHSGLVPSLKTETSLLYATVPDAEIINKLLTAESPMEYLYKAACRNGFSQEEAMKAIQRHPANDRGRRDPLAFSYITEGSVFTIGDYPLTCIATPGHTKGHICLYEANRRILFAGDHILGDISPNITCWDDGNPLEDFLTSLKKIARISVELVLPGHRRVFTDCRGRIDELQDHHQRRAAEAFDILAEGPLTGYQVAARMTWDMVYRSWEEVAPAQKFFATGEALSHLRYLENQGRIQHRLENEKYIYFR